MRWNLMFGLALIALGGCANTIPAPVEPVAGPPLAEEETAAVRLLVAGLAAEDPARRKSAAEELRGLGLRAGPALFEGADDGTDVELQAASEFLIRELTAKTWSTSPPASEAFRTRLRNILTRGNRLKTPAWQWVCRVALLEDARLIIPDPKPALKDEDLEIRRLAATLLLRYGESVRPLADLLPDILKEVAQNGEVSDDWDEILIALATATGKEELAEVRVQLRDFVSSAGGNDVLMAWWPVRQFFQRLGPPSEPLLADILLNEISSPLRTLAALSYCGSKFRSDLEAAWATLPDDDLALALGNSGSGVSIDRVLEMLEVAEGSREQWGAEFALEAATGLWCGAPSLVKGPKPLAAAWRKAIQESPHNPPRSGCTADGNFVLAKHESGWAFELGMGPFTERFAGISWPDMATWATPVFDPSTAAMDLLHAAKGNWLLIEFAVRSAVLKASREEKLAAVEQARRLVLRAAASAGGVPYAGSLNELESALRAASGAQRAGALRTLSDPQANESDRIVAARHLALGDDTDAAAIEAALAAGLTDRVRAAAYMSLAQVDTLKSWLIIASHVADRTALMPGEAPQKPAALALLLERYMVGDESDDWPAIVAEGHERIRKLDRREWDGSPEKER